MIWSDQQDPVFFFNLKTIESFRRLCDDDVRDSYLNTLCVFKFGTHYVFNVNVVADLSEAKSDDKN